MKEALRLYRLRGQVYDSQGEVEYHVGYEPMEVDALKGGGKGRGFGSAKSRGRGGCFLCGQQGHIQANCTVKGKGKGKSKDKGKNKDKTKDTKGKGKGRTD